MQDSLQKGLRGPTARVAGWLGLALLGSPAAQAHGPAAHASGRVASSSLVTAPRHVAGTPCGTMGIVPIGPTAGPTGYATLTEAFADLNLVGVCANGSTFELQSNYVSTAETFPIVYSYTGASATSPVTVRPASGATGLSISGSATAIFQVVNGDYLTIDGRPGGTGTTSQLSITNTSTGTAAAGDGSAIRFVDDATFNTVRYCALQSAAVNASGGLVSFGTTTPAVTGNSNNTIEFCDFVTTPVQGVYSAGTAAAPNSTNRILSNNLHDFTRLNGATGGVNLTNTGNTGWEISNNSVYQPGVRTYTTGAIHFGILIGGGTGYTIKNNFIGGEAPLAASGTYTLATTGNITTRFVGIQGTFALTGTNLIQGNTVRRFNLTTGSSVVSASGLWSGIYVTGNATIGGAGTGEGNTIGDGTSTGTGSVVTTANATSVTYGISCGASGTLSIVNNTVGGITAAAVGGASGAGVGLTGIQSTGGTNTITGNTVTNLQTTNVNTTLTASQRVQGILCTNVISAVIQGNTVSNLSNAANANSPAFQAIGILATGGLNTIGGPGAGEGNTVSNLSNAAPNLGTGGTSAVIGIGQTGTTITGQSLVGNTVSALGSAGAGATVVGILYSGAATGTNLVARNLVHSLTSSAATTLYGIQVAAGLVTVGNNMVRLGLDATGASLPDGGLMLGGLYKSAAASTVGTSFLHNSVYIGGTAGTGAANTFAFGRANDNADVLVNNVLVNARAAGTGNTGQHVPVQLNTAATLTVSNNVYFTTNTLAPGTTAAVVTVGGTAAATVPGDAGSLVADPQFIAPTAATPNLHISATTSTPVEGTGTATATLTDDFDGQTRSDALLTPVDIGADAGGFVAFSATPPSITFTPLGNTTATTNRTLTATITDATTGGVLASSVRLYYRKAGGTYAFVTGTLTTGTAANGTYTFDLPAATLGLVGGDVVEYYVVAQNANGGAAVSTATGGSLAGTGAPAVPATYTLQASYSGAYTVPSTTFPTLTDTGGLFDKLNTGAMSGNVTVTLTASSLTEPGTVALNQLLEEGPNAGTLTLTILGNGTALTVSGTAATGLIRLNGADRVTFNGAGKTVTFRNADPAGPTFVFQNDATNNTLTAAVVESANAGLNSGTVVFGPSTGTLGNSDNTITGCDLRDLSTAAGVPANAVYSNGTATALNARNLIQASALRNFGTSAVRLTGTGNGDAWQVGGATSALGNTIYQEAARTGAIAAVWLSGGSGHVVSNNSFYQTSGALAGTFSAVTLSGGAGYTVNANSVGGQTATRTGAPLVFDSGDVIRIAAGTGTATEVQGNLVGNLQTTSATGATSLVNVVTGSANVGTTTANIFGGGTESFSPNFDFDFIRVNSTAPATVVIAGNTLANLTTTGTTGTGNARCAGVNVPNPATAALTVRNNTIRDWSVQTLSGQSTVNSKWTYGIGLATTGTVTVQDNQIYNLVNTNVIVPTVATAVLRVAGITMTTPGAGSVVQRNRIYGLSAASAGTGTFAPVVYGFRLYGATGTATFANNQVTLGATTNEPILRGIDDGNTSATVVYNYYYNSVLLTGTTANTTNKSYAFFRSNTTTPSTATLRNNVLVNLRTGGGANIALGLGTTPAVTFSSNYNNLYASVAANTTEAAGTTQNFAAWQALAGTPDLNSQHVNVKFTDPATGNLGLDETTNCALNNAGIAIMGVDGEYGNAATSRQTTPDIGSDEFTPATGPQTATIARSGPACGSTTVAVTITGGNGPFTVTYTDGTTPVTATATTSPFTFTGTSGATYTLTSVTDAYGCSLARVGSAAISNQTTYTGAAPGDGTNWFNVANWTTCVPTSTIDATIPAGLTNYPVLTTAATAEVQTLTLAAGARLSQNAGLLNISGNLVNNTPTANVVLTSGTVAFVSNTAQTLSGAQPVSFFNLTVNKAADTLRVTTNQTVRGTLALTSGILKTYVLSAVNKITLNGTITETATSFVLGDVEVPAVALSTNNATSNFGGVGLTLTARALRPGGAAASFPGLTAVTRSTGTPVYGGSGSRSIRRRYSIAPALDTNLSVDLVFGYNDSNFELNGIGESRLRLFSAPTLTGPFRLEDGTPDATANTVTRTGLDHLLARWTLGDQAAPLPVRAATFGSETAFSTAPNPFTSTLTLSLRARTANPAARLTVSDLNGRTVRVQPLAIPAGESQAELRGLDGLPAGLYLLTLPLDGQPQHLKVVKQ